MDNSRLAEALTWLGPLSMRELARVLNLSVRQTQRHVTDARIGRDDEGRVSLGARRPKPPRPAVVAIRDLLAGDDGDVYADWVEEQTGYKRRAVYEALRDLGYTSRRGRGAMWTRGAMAAK